MKKSLIVRFSIAIVVLITTVVVSAENITRQSTDWMYSNPTALFSSELFSPSGSSSELLSNPVFYNGAIYVISGSSKSRAINKVIDGNAKSSWSLKFSVKKGSFAFVTQDGQMEIITENMVLSCDLKNIDAGLECSKINVGEVSINSNEPPTVGEDGTLYFKNISDDGSIIKIDKEHPWKTKLKFKSVSPIVLNKSGTYAYVLVNVSIASNGQNSESALVRINTQNGVAEAYEISACSEGEFPCNDSEKDKPLFTELLKPTVIQKKINNTYVDYVFVAGNESGIGLLQLSVFHEGKKDIWSRWGKLAVAPVLSVKNGNTLFAVQEGKLTAYPWYNPNGTTLGAVSDVDMQEKTLGEITGITNLLIDGDNTVYLYDKKTLHVYPSGTDRKTIGTIGELTTMSNKNLTFISDGSLIGYDGNNIYDFSLKAKNELVSPSELKDRTVYSANEVRPLSGSADSINAEERVILKGRQITLPAGFHWPLGAELKLQNVVQ